jgi:hypothetical protein
MHQHFVGMSCTKFHANWSRDMESMGINVLKLFDKVGFQLS